MMAEKDVSDIKIIASLTTIPARLNHIKPLIENVLSQTVKIAHIELNLPYVLKRNNEPYCLPEWLAEYEKAKQVVVFRTEDYGPITKIAPTLMRYYNDASTFIWQIDDDIIYEPNHLASLMRAHNPKIHRILARHGCMLNLDKSVLTAYTGQCELKSNTPGNFGLMEGFGSILYPPNCVQADFMDYINSVIQSRDCFLSDDIVLSYYFLIKNVVMYMYNCNTKPFYPPAHVYAGVDSLGLMQADRHLTKYVRVVRYLRTFYPDAGISYLDSLRVFAYDTNKKLRLGAMSDGGYIIAEGDFDKYDCYISAGINNEESFSRDFIKKYGMNKTNCFGFDGTIDKYPAEYTSDITFIKKNISDYNDDGNTNLHHLIQNYSNIFLKMDIEGCEYRWLLSLDENQLARFAQIVIEFHGIYDSTWKANHADKIKCFEKLAKTHYIIHAHANNDGTTFMNIPSVVELTYVNKRIFKNTAEPEFNTAIFPIDNLDVPNHDYAVEISLMTYPFVSLQYMEKISIGSSETNIKVISLKHTPPYGCRCHIVRHRYKDTFDFTIMGDKLIVRRTDYMGGWGLDHSVILYM